VPSTNGYADLGSARIYYETAGAGEPVVFLHAGIADRRMWDPQFGEFARDYRVVRYDLRGFGLTRAEREPFSHVDDLIGLLRHLGIARAHLVGLSKGGSVALDVAISAPEVVASLVLAATAPSGYQRFDLVRQGWIEGDAAMERGDVERAIEIDLEMWVDGPTRGPDAIPAATRAWLRELVAGTYAVPEVGPEIRLEPPAINRLGEVRAPTLVLVGDADMPDMLPAAELLTQEIPSSRRVVLANVAHVLNVERPAEFNAAVREFFAK
jgi:pimeloyl-ACP methyl ester carboxylesterase